MEGLLAQIAMAVNADVTVSDAASAPLSSICAACTVQPQAALDDLFALCVSLACVVAVLSRQGALIFARRPSSRLMEKKHKMKEMYTPQD
jgi:hypothetical protein